MQLVTIVRGANGVVVWANKRTGVEQWAWVCLRDNFQVAIPQTQAGLEGFLLAVATHSSSLVGQVAQVVQLQV